MSYGITKYSLVYTSESEADIIFLPVLSQIKSIQTFCSFDVFLHIMKQGHTHIWTFCRLNPGIFLNTLLSVCVIISDCVISDSALIQSDSLDVTSS